MRFPVPRAPHWGPAPWRDALQMGFWRHLASLPILQAMCPAICPCYSMCLAFSDSGRVRPVAAPSSSRNTVVIHSFRQTLPTSVPQSASLYRNGREPARALFAIVSRAQPLFSGPSATYTIEFWMTCAPGHPRHATSAMILQADVMISL